jgi:hypothetical protein
LWVVEILTRVFSVPRRPPDGGVFEGPPRESRTFRQNRRGFHGDGVHSARPQHRPSSRREEDGLAQAAAPGAPVQRGGDNARLPPPQRGRDVRQLPGERRALGGDGVPGGRGPHRHRHPLADGRGTDRHRLQAVPQGALLPALAGRHPPRHQIRLDPAGPRRQSQTVRLRVLRPSVAGAAQEEVAGGDAVLDVAGSDQSAAVRAGSGHLVVGDNGDRNGGRGTAVLQRAAPASHEADQRDAAAQAEERPQSVAAVAEFPRQDVGEGSRAKGDGARASGASVLKASRSTGASGAADERRQTL